ncbi:antitoxin Xre/MbcA/ParS toxin-binding domain-containing protein [Methylobacterium frigidaeris]|uniref:antitoxin Xre/MbcA/ParS toxin-binding domain-containing protein n=1 Tax=Methylobacterium frigidaeris TaxID=2038277 RepID=UPI001EDEBE59|nr:antitoxin Xre/MbcA/ParS toxin-binding domain-containing protein [Methylobacterium frigidaeris]
MNVVSGFVDGTWMEYPMTSSPNMSDFETGDASQLSVFDEVDTIAQRKASTGDIDFSLPARVIPDFENQGVWPQEIETIIGPRDRLLRAVNALEDLDPDQTDRAARLAHIVSLAEKIFGRKEKAFVWLRLNNRTLGNKSPFDILHRESGARMVEEALMRISYGIPV